MPAIRWPNERFLNLARIDLPIVQAAMGGATAPRLAAAVSNAGGVGMLGLAGATADEVRRSVRRTRELTDRPFGVNLIMHWPPDDVVPILCEEGVPVLSFFWGDCSRFVAPAHRAGAVVLHSVGSVEEARRAADWGVDALVAQGWEAGGHVRGTVSTLALTPAVVDAVGDIPVLAAGGIADGRGVAAAFALGAAGVWVGTRYLAATEANVHPHYRQRILQAGADDTAYFENLFDITWPDAPHRTLRSETTTKWEEAGRPAVGSRPGEGEIVASEIGEPILRYTSQTPNANIVGNVEAMSLWAGQGVGLVRREQGAGEITRELASEAEAIFARLSPNG